MRRQPQKGWITDFGKWLLEHFSGSPNNDAILGDLEEQYARGKSRLWYSKEVAAAIVVRWCGEVFTKRILIMKRMAVWTVVLTATFFLGFWTARSTLLIPVEVPSMDSFKRQMEDRGVATDPYNIRGFLQIQLDEARTNDRRQRSAASKKRVEDFEKKLAEAQRRFLERRR